VHKLIKREDSEIEVQEVYRKYDTDCEMNQSEVVLHATDFASTVLNKQKTGEIVLSDTYLEGSHEEKEKEEKQKEEKQKEDEKETVKKDCSVRTK
jgi:hypothetical protein